MKMKLRQRYHLVIYLFIFLEALQTSFDPQKNYFIFFFNNLNYSSKRWFVVFRGSVGIQFWREFSLRNANEISSCVYFGR